MRYLKRNSLFILMLAALMLLSACSSKKIIFDAPKDIYIKVTEKNQAVCAYKGRITVIYKNKDENVRFKGLLNKDCAENFHLKVMGLFNTVAYDVQYFEGDLKAMKNNEDVSSEMAYFMKSRGLDDMVSLIRYPHVKVTPDFRSRAVDDEYVLSKGDLKVYVRQDFLIRKVTLADESFTYTYDNDKLAGLTYEFEDVNMEIHLR